MDGGVNSILKVVGFFKRELGDVSQEKGLQDGWWTKTEKI